ncbi:rho GTPase-activating protein 20 isoform X2 [Corythoichthys intestinalis]|uniref:rho GTPase-activating protein 20 isoform X2 n=1 Tax=Corythoichthys intestinalis TaxID=161448 RepID=UPI0025A4E648|nr:rho GTPase-activating protein 20 isoform X2 [Corythoichthys intestinalis]XP_057707629.1 rho GTPase-activating protein 20 isoform X2 [Corythoichthys intestinalis]XP_057707631.1 rho GTPase-activating protein 20 isoform X2 [Corythoichthys intestinalis]XP_057707632.1 rho GTPase-activating protein 20 isoform X2 [Corythoichthys intestinalis]XP_057707633.1 rho GTPase-activating protein 20 isoform X2 [Corythoichthys intestinalis]XP_057707634.1 rho GTPase-activating protein 20 isoform X2 [Corythoich
MLKEMDEQEEMARGRAGSCVEFHSLRKMKTLAQRRQSAPSLVISKALTRSRSTSRESCMIPVSPESCGLVQSFLSECPGRAFLGHVQVHMKTGLQTQDRHLFLFTDTLIVTKTKSPSHFKVKARVRVCEMWTAGCVEEVCEGSTNPERSFVLGWPTCNCVVTFSSEEHKEKWLMLIRSRINEGKDKDDPKTVPLKIFAKDIGNCAYAKTLAVNNIDNTNDVIRMALNQFGIDGHVKDHRLWVSSSKDEPPYPLIGHEFPFSIKMSYIRNGVNGGPDITSPCDCPEVLLLDRCLPAETRCHFILKPSRVTHGNYTLIDAAQSKSFKRKRSLINWPFWRGSSNHLDVAPPLSPTSPVPSPGHLFGQPLASVCSVDAGLPKPVMDMLVFLYVEGPYTRGVFRRSAGAKACRELRERLDAGRDDGEITHQSVFVVAAVLKDFLRSLPGSLLCSELYDQWTAAMENEGSSDVIGEIQRLLRLLPAENFLLLRHVAAVLHRIQGYAHDNQMNAFNLSVCIAPSMLWASTPGTPEMEGEGAKKVCELVRFLIENCTAVLGDDVTNLFSAFSPKCGGSEHGSDASSFQMNDSSYDSLENELNDEPESPCQEQLPLREKRDKPDSRSRDSVLTLSDCEADGEGRGDDLLLQLPPLARPRRFSPVVRQPRTRYTNGAPSQGANRRLRRSSEPALAALAGGSLPLRKASYDAAMEGEEEEEEFLEKEMNGLHLNSEGDHNSARRKNKHIPPPPLRLDASCSSLSSPATSPTGSSLSSLDSAFSQYSTDYSAVPMGDVPLRSPRCSPPQKDPRPGHGAHPNTWLKKDRRLSLKQPLNGHTSEVSSPAGAQSGTPNCRSSSPPSYQQALLQLQRTSAFYKGADKTLTVQELRILQDAPNAGSDAAQPPMGVFYGQSATTLVLKRQKSHSLTPPIQSRTLPRRRSEPSCMNSKTSTLERPRGRLRVSNVEPLSPSANRTVRDYFSASGDTAGCAHHSQEVALAIAQAKREWHSQQCSEPPRLDDFDQLFFAEESYV